jgi:6-pyruvoyltetrahydropterin/6-carboxytetrahydropterin synthase
MSRHDASLPFTVGVVRTFAARHAIRLSDGSVEPSHEHQWRLTVTVGSQQLDSLGMVMDFHLLEGIVDRAIAPTINANFNAMPDFGTGMGQVNPTAEQIAAWVGCRIAAQLPDGVCLVGVQLGEAPGCEAGWRPR